MDCLFIAQHHEIQRVRNVQYPSVRVGEIKKYSVTTYISSMLQHQIHE